MADIKFLNNISLENLQLKNAKIQVVSTDPVLVGASYEGRIIYNSNDNSIKFHNGSNSDYWVKLDGARFWNLGTAPNSIFTTKMASIGQDANIVNSKLNVYKTEDMTASVPHIATFNESSSNHSANLWPNPGDNSADIYGSISRGTFTGAGSVDQIKGAELIGRHSGSGSVNIIQGSQAASSLTGSGSTEIIVASYAKTFVAGTGSNNIENAIGAWNTVELNGLNDVDYIFGTYSNLALTKGEVNDEAIGHYINFQQVAADTEINNLYYIHAKNDSLSVTGEKFFIKDETGIPSQFSNKLVLNAYGSGTFTGTATQRLAVDTNGNVIEIPIGSGPVDGSGTANYTARWTDSDTLSIGALYDNGTQVGIGTNNPDTPLHVVGNVKIETTGSVDNLLLTSTDATLTGAPDISLFADTAAADGDTIGNIQFRGRNGMVPGSTAPLTYAAFYSHIIDKDNNQSILALTGHKGNGSGANKTVANFSVIGTNNSGEGAVLINPSSGYTPSSYNLEVNGDFKVVDDAYFDSNVGIGTTSPGYKLEVSGNSLVTGTQFIGDTFTKIQQAGGNLLFSNLSSSGGIEFRTNSTEKMRILANGNVGIGTTSPGEKLEVNGNIRLSDESELYIQGGTSSRKIVRLDNTNDKGLITLNRGDETKVSISSDVTTHGHTYFNGLNTNVGIGTTSPNAKLHLSDSTSGGNPSFILQDNARSGAAALNYILLTDSLNANQAKIGYLSGLNTDLTLQNLVGSTSLVSSGQIKVTAGTNTIFENSGSERMRITSSGNVGIGTSSPSQKLDIVGGSLRVNSETGREATLTGFELRFSRNSVNYIYATDSAGSIRIVTGGNVQGSAPTADFKSNKDSIFYGNVGIGTTTPSSKLDVAGDIASQGIYVDRTHEFGGISNPFAKLGLHYFWGDSNNITLQKTGNNNKYTFATQTGYLQIENSSGAKLQIRSSDQSVKSASGTFNLGVTQHGAANNNQGNYVSITNGGNTTGSRGVINVNGDLKINDYSTSSAIEKIKLKNDGSAYFTGNVGIGTTSPSEKLEVAGQYGNTTLSGHVVGFNRASANYLWAKTSGGDLRFTVNGNAIGSPSMTLSTAGNLGIGTTNPTKKLHVNGDAFFQNTVSLPDNAYVGLGSSFDFHLSHNGSSSSITNSTGNLNISSNGGDAVFNTASTERLRITSTGNVGIGTTSPQGKLDISTASSSDIFNLRIHNLAGETSQSTGILFNTGYTDVSRGKGGLVYEYDTSAGWNRGDFHFLQRQDGGSGIARLSDSVVTIKNNGNLGVGTTSPSEKLDVVGTGRFTGQVTIPSTPIASTDAASKGYVDAQIGNADTLSEVLALGNTTGGTNIDVSPNDVIDFFTGSNLNYGRIHANSEGLNLNTVANRHMIFSKGSTETMRIDTSGNVGIGTTTPSYKLEVNGTIAQSALQSAPNDDVDDIVYSRFFKTHTNTTNEPSAIPSFGMGINLEYSTGNSMQLMSSRNSTEALYMRKQTNSSWGSWVKIRDSLQITDSNITNWNTAYSNWSPGISSDWNNINTNAFIKGHLSTSNYPPELSQSFLSGLSVLYSSGNGWQLASNRGSGSNLYHRHVTNGTWYSWKRLIDSDDIYVDNSTGNVGIGTTSPDYLFEVEKTTSGSATLASFKNTENTAIRISRTGASPGTSYLNVVNNGALYTSSDSHIAFQPGNSTSVFMQSTGNVGIGTTSPSHKLTAVGGTNGRVARLGNLEITTQAATYTGSSIEVTGSNSFIKYNSTLGHKFFTRVTGGGNTLEALTIVPDTGNVGVGTTNPTAKLDVDGGVKIGDDTDTASANKVGTVRYRTSGNNSYVDMCMQTGATTYEWINIVQNNW